MKNYGLKVTTPYDDDLGEIFLDLEENFYLKNSGKYYLRCIKSINIYQEVHNFPSHLIIEMLNDDLNINIFCKSFVKENEVADIYQKIIINKNNCQIKLNIRGIAEDNSKIIYRSEIYNQKDINSEVLQNAKFYLLSSKAEIDIEPALNINSKNLKTSHEASISNFFEENVFYLQSKGYNEEEIKQELIDSFLNIYV